jgi:hypothetical protein
MQGCRLCVYVVASCLLSGCEIGSTMFQMDSNSGRPFFGVNLLPARKTAQVEATAKPTSPSSLSHLRNGGTKAPVATVSETKSAEPSLLERLKLKRPPERVPLSLAKSDEEAGEGPVEEFR